MSAVVPAMASSDSFHTMRYRRHYWGLAALIGVAVGATAWAALTPVESDSREQVYIIPKGTWARRMAGEDIEILPSEIRLTIGVKDVLVLQNQDDVPQLFGPVLIMPGQSFRLPFGRASRYQFACSLHVSGQLDVIVNPMPEPGWPRLWWRAIALANAGASR
jgi:hypothetical protein